MQTHPNLSLPRARHESRPRIVVGAIAALLCLTAVAQQAGIRRLFNIPAQGAESALKVFSEQSGKGVIMNANTVEGIRTNRLSGSFTPLEALQHLLAGTGLIATPDEQSEAFVVHRANPPFSHNLPSGDRASGNQTPKEPNRNPMTKNNLLASLSSALALFLTPAAHSAEGGGMIVGRVLNATNGSYLENARVTIHDTSLVAFTDSFGEYRFARVRPGPVQITAFHTGLAGQTATVTVTAGQTARQDFSLQAKMDRDDVVKLGAYVVSSSREMDGAAIAINEQRFAPNIKTVIAADEFGAMADGNVGELLKFVPGVTLRYTAGEAAQISLDGVPPDNVPISVGGFDLASARINTLRATEISQFSVNNVARIEVSHTPTPEITGTALAGSINMVPRSAFERATPVFNASALIALHGRYPTLRKTAGPLFESTYKVYPSFNFSYIRPVNERFGFTLSGATSARLTNWDFMTNTWRGGGTTTNGTTFPDTTPDQPYLTSYLARYGQTLSRRSSAAATLDFKLSPNDSLSVSLQYAYFNQPVTYRTQTYSITRVLPGNFSSRFTHGAPGAGGVSTGHITDDKSGRTYMPTITYRHRGPTWKAEAGAGLSHSTNRFDNTTKGFFQQSFTDRTGLTVSFDDVSPIRPGRITVTDGVTGAPIDDEFGLSRQRITTIRGAEYWAANLQRNAFANVRRDFFGRVSLSLKAGFDVRQAARDLRQSQPTYTSIGADGVANSADDSASPVVDRAWSQLDAPYGFPRMEKMSNKALFDLVKSNPAYFRFDEAGTYNTAVAGSKYSEEIISAAYFRGDAQFFEGRLKLVGGLRAEQTNVKGEGQLIDPTRNQQRDVRGNVIRDANGRPVPITTSALEAVKLTNIDRGLHAKKEYLRWFPSLNASFNVKPDLIARVGHYWSVGRPNLVQYAGSLTLPDPGTVPSSSNRFSVNNAGIKAWSARSTKATLEYYFSRVGLISINGFRREIDNFFVSTVFPATPEFLALYGLQGEDYVGYDVSTQRNSPDKVRMEGYDINYKQALTFLPHWARGVQVFANLSALRVTGAGAGNFTGFVPRTINWGVSLSRPKYDLRIDWNFRERARSSLVSGRGIEPGTYSWDARQMRVDVSANYFISKRLALFAGVSNLNGQPTNPVEIAGPNTPEHAHLQSFTGYDGSGFWVFGLKGSF